MSNQRRPFRRFEGILPSRKLFVIAVEGEKTEKEYFDVLRKMQSSTVCIECLNSKTDSSPHHVLNRMKKHLANNELKGTDEAWLVVDKAIKRAKRRDNPPCEDWPRNPGGTTVYRLVERILNG